jgi:hypothetical protein
VSDIDWERVVGGEGSVAHHNLNMVVECMHADMLQ